MPNFLSETSLKGVFKILPTTDYRDIRGRYLEIYNKKEFCDADVTIEFLQDDVSVSRKNVLRGIHGDTKTWKLVTCLYGAIHLVVINYDQSSKEYGKWQSFLIDENNRFQVLIPPRFGNGHFVLSDYAVFHYKQSTYYAPDSQFTIFWNDSRFNFDWPTTNPILSPRDSANT